MGCESAARRRRTGVEALLERCVAGGLVVLVIATPALSGCRPRRADPKPEVRARVLPADGVVRLVATRLPPSPARWLASTSSIRCELYVDPELADLEHIAGYTVWSNATGEWARLAGVSPAGRAGMTVELSDGRHGLWVSGVEEGGSREILLPTPFDEPLAWVYVDTTPPAIEWRVEPKEPIASPSPAGGSPAELGAPDDGESTAALGTGTPAPASSTTQDAADSDGALLLALESTRIPLTWRIEEAQLAPEPLHLEWSRDGGTTWSPIGDVPARSGEQSFTWDLPSDVPERVEVRLTAQDAAGHTAAAVLPLRIGGPLGALALAADAPLGPDGTSGGETASGEPSSLGEGDENVDDPELASADGAASDAVLARAPEASETPDADSARDVPVEGGAPIIFEAAGPRCLRPGEDLHIAWRAREGAEVDPDSRIVLERRASSGAADSGWAFAGESTLGANELTWTLPGEPDGRWALRVSIAPAPGASPVTLPLEGDLVVDGSPPRVTIADAPKLVGANARFSLAIGGAGEACSGLESIRVWTRPVGQRFWDPLPADRIVLEPGPKLALDLGRLPEGRCELFLAGRDALGNEGPEPLSDATPALEFALDRTPPRLLARELVLDWVAGCMGEALIDIEAADIAPPIVIEGRQKGGEFQEVLRIPQPVLPQGRIAFEVPGIDGEYELRVRVTDRAGNTAEEHFGPRPVVPPLRVDGFGPGTILIAGANERITWTLHPVALDRADEWEVAIEHQPRPGAAWLSLASGLRAVDRHHYWRIPAADVYEHRIRVIARRGDAVACIDTSGPFRIHALEVGAAKEPDIDPASRAAVREANAGYARLVSGSGGPDAVDPGQVEKKFRDALALDPRNWEASYGLAQLLRYVDPDGTREEVVRLLEETVAKAPDAVEPLEDLGAAHLARGQWADAERVLRRALAGRETGRTLYNLALAVLYQGRGADARVHLEKALTFLGEEGLDEGNVRGYLVFSYLVDGADESARAVYATSRDRIPQALREAIEARL